MIAAWLAAPEAELAKLLFASVRGGAALAMLPGIGGALLPIRVRIGLAAALGWLVAGSMTVPDGPALLGAVAGEVMIGGAVGIVLQALFATASIAGELLAQAMGLGFATIVQPGGTTSPVVTTFLSLLLWAVFIGVDGHARLFALLVHSFETLPPGAVPDARAVALLGGLAFGTGALLALPIAGVLVLANLWLAVLAKSAPQLNLFSVGFAVLTVVGLVTLPLALPAMLGTMGDAVADAQEALAALLGA